MDGISKEKELTLHEYSLIANGAIRLAIVLHDIDTAWLKKKNFQRLMTWLTEDKDRMLCFLEGGDFIARTDEKKQLIPLRISPESLNQLLPSIDPEEHRFRKLCGVLMDTLGGMCETVSLMTGRDANEVFNDALRKGKLEVESTSDSITIHLSETKEEKRFKAFEERMAPHVADDSQDTDPKQTVDTEPQNSATSDKVTKATDEPPKTIPCGKRKFIMVQMPEPCNPKSEAYKAGYENIAEIGKERIRRAAKKIAEEHPGVDFDGGFRVLRLDTPNSSKPKTDEEELFQAMIDLGIPQAAAINKQTVCGFEWSVVEHESKVLYACYDQKLSAESVSEVISRKPTWIISPRRPDLNVILKEGKFLTDREREESKDKGEDA